MKKILYFIKYNTNKILIIILLLFLYSFLCSFIYANNISTGLKQNVFRLHVIANSNSKEDQDLKYIVRDSLINYMQEICKYSKSKEETIYIVSDHIDDFVNIANNLILDNGFNYTASVEIGNFKFPTKQYGDICFPAGYYDALEVKLGKSAR